MTCNELQGQLAAFHFGELPLDARNGIEAHLCGCLTCVRALLEFKRVVELAEGGPRPSETARQSLREAVATELGLRWHWWERPVALFVAASSVVLAVFLTNH